MKVNIKSCQRCGQDHEQMEVSPLTNAVDMWKYWGDCPVLHEPVLLQIRDKETDREDGLKTAIVVTHNDLRDAFALWHTNNQRAGTENSDWSADDDAAYFGSLLNSVIAPE